MRTLAGFTSDLEIYSIEEVGRDLAAERRRSPRRYASKPRSKTAFRLIVRG
jgi:hypothetical protein